MRKTSAGKRRKADRIEQMITISGNTGTDDDSIARPIAIFPTRLRSLRVHPQKSSSVAEIRRHPVSQCADGNRSNVSWDREFLIRSHDPRPELPSRYGCYFATATLCAGSDRLGAYPAWTAGRSRGAGGVQAVRLVSATKPRFSVTAAREIVAAIKRASVKTCREIRSEERRVGKECIAVCRSRWSPYH